MWKSSQRRISRNACNMCVICNRLGKLRNIPSYWKWSQRTISRIIMCNVCGEMQRPHSGCRLWKKRGELLFKIHKNCKCFELCIQSCNNIKIFIFIIFSYSLFMPPFVDKYAGTHTLAHIHCLNTARNMIGMY